MALTTNDITEIQQVQALYSHAVDWPDQTWLPKVFTEDAVFDARPCGHQDNFYDSLRAIQAFFALGKPPHPKAHYMTNVYVYEDGGKVRVKAKWLVRNPKRQEIFLGDYDDIMERTPDGWRIKHRVVTTRDPSNTF